MSQIKKKESMHMLATPKRVGNALEYTQGVNLSLSQDWQSDIGIEVAVTPK